MQQARALQQSEAFGEYRKRRQVSEHRLTRLVQLGIRQSRYFGRTKTLFQLLMAATVANLTLVAARMGMMKKTSHKPAYFLASFHQYAVSVVRVFINNLRQYLKGVFASRQSTGIALSTEGVIG